MSQNKSQDKLDLQTDEWFKWLLHERHAGNAEFATVIGAATKRVADRVLDAADLAPGMTLADIGAGDGLIAFGAIVRVGPSLRVTFTDISLPLLRHAERLATERGVRDQCTFLLCSAEKLADIPDASVDVVTTRAVLAYVSDKQAALREFYRILKAGGRLSIAEPMLRDEAIEAVALKKMLDDQPRGSQDRLLSIVHRWKAAQFPDTEEKLAQSPITNYSERDLVRFAQVSGFKEIHMEFHIDIFPSIITAWDVYLGYSPHPWAPSVGTILAEQCSSEEREIFEHALRPIVEGHQSNSIERVVYLTATKSRV